MTINKPVNIFTISRGGEMENSKMIGDTPSHILFYFSIVISWILIKPFSLIMIQSLMGDDMTILILVIYGLIGFSLVLMIISKIKYNFLMASLISAVYSTLVGFIYFRFLPTMKELAETYESTDPNTSFTSSHGFDPSTVDFAFYDQLLLISLIFFILVTIISGIGVVRNLRMEKKTKFKIVKY